MRKQNYKMWIAAFVFLSGTVTVGANTTVGTIAEYPLTDGNGSNTSGAPSVYVQNAVFSDYTRVNVTPSSGSGFFVSKGWPLMNEEYDETKAHTFTITPTNGSTLYLKQFTMDHKRSGSGASDPKNTVYFKCMVSYDGNTIELGSGETVNKTGTFTVDNLKIVTQSPVTVTLTAKNFDSASQSWMQRNVSLVGAVIPEGEDVEDVTGPLEPTYVPVVQDYINCLQIFDFNVDGQLAPPSVSDISGMPVSYTVLVDESVDLAQVKCNYILPDGVRLEGAMPSDFSVKSKQSVTLVSSWGTRKVNISVKKLNKASDDFDLIFDTNNLSVWTPESVGWIADGLAAVNEVTAQLSRDNAVFVVGSDLPIKAVDFDLVLDDAVTTAFSGMVSIEQSEDGKVWTLLSLLNSCKPVTKSSDAIHLDITGNVKYLRWTYDCQNNRQNINLNNLSVKMNKSGAVATSVVKDVAMYPNPVSDKLYVKSGQPVQRIEVYDVSGKCVMSREGISDFPVSFKSLSCGSYLVKLTLSDKSVVMSNILKQ